MSIRRLRARIEKLEAAYFRQSRMADLISKFKTRDLTEEEEKEARSLTGPGRQRKPRSGRIGNAWLIGTMKFGNACIIRNTSLKKKRSVSSWSGPKQNPPSCSQPEHFGSTKPKT